MYAKFKILFQNVQKMGPVSLFQNLNLGKASTNDKWHLTIPWARSCQYQCVCKISSQNSTQFKRWGHFQNLVLSKDSTDDKCHFAIPWARSCQYQCVWKIHQNIPNALRVMGIFSPVTKSSQTVRPLSPTDKYDYRAHSEIQPSPCSCYLSFPSFLGQPCFNPRALPFPSPSDRTRSCPPPTITYCANPVSEAYPSLKLVPTTRHCCTMLPNTPFPRCSSNEEESSSCVRPINRHTAL